MYYFLKEDFDVLLQEIKAIDDCIKLAAKEMGLSCQYSSETFHDNFAFEQAERDRNMWSNHIHKLIEVRNNANIIVPGPNQGKVSIGRTVKIRDLSSLIEKTFQIGSYMILNTKKTKETMKLSYDAPLPKALIGAKEGDQRETFLGGKKHCFLILKVE